MGAAAVVAQQHQAAGGQGKGVVGAFIGVPGRGGAPLLLLINGRDMDASFRLPPGQWVAELDTSEPSGRSTWQRGAGDEIFMLASRSVVLLRDAGPSTRKAPP